MRPDPNNHHRHSIRLPGYDTSQAGAYFVTMVTQGRACLFGEVVEGEMRLNPPGQMVERWWYELNNKFPTVALGEFVVMPNHFHGVIIINNDPVDGAEKQGAHTGAPLPTIIQWFKTMTTNEYIRGVKQLGWEPFAGKLWQRNYYEHIIRNDAELERIDIYITNNPANWQADDENPGKSP